MTGPDLSSGEKIDAFLAEMKAKYSSVKPETAADGSGWRPTTLHWYNDVHGAKIGCLGCKYKEIPYGAALTAEFIAAGTTPHPVHGHYQTTGIACAPQLFTIILDGDYTGAWAETATGKLLGDWRKVATSIRDCGGGTFKFHVLVEVPPHLADLWPKQRQTDFGHIKSNGFAYVEGVHATGTAYVATGNPRVVADEALMRAFLADNGNHLDSESDGGASDDNFDDWAAQLENPDGAYLEDYAASVLGNWAEGTRNPSLVTRCGIIKAAGEMGRAGMATLFADLCGEYDTATGRGDSDVYRAFTRCHTAYAKVNQITQESVLPAEWSQTTGERYVAAVAASPVPVPGVNGQRPAVAIAPPGAQSPPGAETATRAGALEAAPFVFGPRGHTDQGLGDACLHAVQPQYRYAADVGAWLSAGPERWETHTADLCQAIVSQLADCMPAGVTAAKARDDGLNPEDPAVIAALAQSARRERLQSAGGAGAVASKMKSRVAVAGRHPLAIRLAGLDADPRVIWAGGIPWDIRASRTGLAVAGTDPGTPHLKSCRYAPAVMPTPLWDAFVYAMWPAGWEEIREWALRQLALAVSGYAEKALPILSGVTDTGKTSFVALAADVLGDYAATLSPDLLTGGTGAVMEYARFALKGVRLAFLDEAPRTGKLAQAALKNLTGGGDLHGRPPYGKPVSFRASHTIIATANPESDPPLTDDAVRGRIRLIPCAGNVAAVRAARNAIFPLDSEAWQREAPGVLAALIMRAAEVMADPGLVRNDREPVLVRYWGDHLAAGQNTAAIWYASETEPPDRYVQETRGGELYEDYVAWCRRNDHKPEGNVSWGRRMVKLGCPRRESNSVTWYQRRVRARASGAYR